MSRLASVRTPTICLVAIVMCVYALGGLLSRPHPVAGALANGRIAFASLDDQSDAQIYSMNVDGSDVQQLTTDTNENFVPVWSPDGTKIAYTAVNFNNDSEQILTMRANGSHKVAVTTDTDVQSAMATWSPDGTKLVYVSQPSDFSTSAAISVINTDGTGNLALTDGTSDTRSPVWSPDGTTIAYVCMDSQSVQQVCTMDADGSNQQEITSGTTVDYMNIAYSPDGTEFAYATISHGGGYIQHLGIMDSDGTNQQTITTGYTSVADVSWSPDGTKLIYDNFDTVHTTQRIYYINTDGSDETAVSAEDKYGVTPSWQPASVGDFDSDGTLNTTETAAPNSGDANGDSIADQYQAAVTSVVNPTTGKYLSVQSNCASNTAVSAQALPVNYGDPAFQYPAGLASFTLSCDNSGDTATITQYFYSVALANTMVLRKYNDTTHAHTTIPGSSVSTVTIGGQAATKVTYQITDGGPFDQDGSANGTIVDPVGLAIPLVGVPNTGIGGVTFPRSFAAPLL